MVSEARNLLGYSDCFDDQNSYGAVVSFEDIAKKYSLECYRFDYTLKEWLDQNTTEKDGERTKKGRHSTEFGVRHDNLQASRDARKIIRGILCAYFEVFNSKSYHGSLDDPDNYLISLEKNHDHLSFVPTKVHVRFRFKKLSKRVDSGNIKVEQNHDRHCIRDMIFGEILEANHGIYDQEWQQMHNSLDTFNLGWGRLANHVSLWHWKERFDFFFKLSTWANYGNKGQDPRFDRRTRASTLQDVLRGRLPQYKGWKKDILVDSPLHKFLVGPESSNYSDSVFDLLRFIRNAYQHITEKKKDHSGEYLYIKNHENWAEENVVEHEKTGTLGGCGLIVGQDLGFVANKKGFGGSDLDFFNHAIFMKPESPIFVESSASTGILKCQCAVRPPGKIEATNPDEAVASAI
ncbi:hypothetical protein RHGRI_015837 [Rhododendron griersonianum]|uniref:KEN domain-containing protein n=1 Tax=Rhododendron griersonianum TaxID=479676 RepID=A0AAV6JSP0_9ERIC|nr:hypothetical protein RHGRI_015837 [Rhododendron griersonianum]